MKDPRYIPKSYYGPKLASFMQNNRAIMTLIKFSIVIYEYFECPRYTPKYKFGLIFASLTVND